MQTIVYQCDTAMPAQKLPNCCIKNKHQIYNFLTFACGVKKKKELSLRDLALSLCCLGRIQNYVRL